MLGLFYLYPIMSVFDLSSLKHLLNESRKKLYFFKAGSEDVIEFPWQTLRGNEREQLFGEYISSPMSDMDQVLRFKNELYSKTRLDYKSYANR